MSRPERYPLPNPILKGNVLTIFTTQYTFTDYYKDGDVWRRSLSHRKVDAEDNKNLTIIYESLRKK